MWETVLSEIVGCYFVNDDVDFCWGVEVSYLLFCFSVVLVTFDMMEGKLLEYVGIWNYDREYVVVVT